MGTVGKKDWSIEKTRNYSIEYWNNRERKNNIVGQTLKTEMKRCPSREVE